MLRSKGPGDMSPVLKQHVNRMVTMPGDGSGVGDESILPFVRRLA